MDPSCRDDPSHPVAALQGRGKSQRHQESAVPVRQDSFHSALCVQTSHMPITAIDNWDAALHK